jgi:hypothetical protein
MGIFPPTTETQLLYETKWTQAARDAYYKEKPWAFAGPDQSFPIKDASDVNDAWRLSGHADNPDAVRAKIKSIAQRLGLSQGLPDTAKDAEPQESAATITSSDVRPKKKIATLKVCYLEYGARSLNGRIYPKATCDRIYESAARNLEADDLPMTVFVSHETANSNVNTELVGRVAKVWQEGDKFWAHLDLADTRVARDMLALAEGGYLRSESMRVMGVRLAHDQNYDLPLVVPVEGEQVELLGIDLTTRPGLMDTARIQQVLYEDETVTAPYTESFALDSVTIQQIIAGEMPLTEHGLTSAQAHKKVHDTVAGVMDEAFGAKHKQESIEIAGLDEAGRSIAKRHGKPLAEAHDVAANQLGMDCEGCYKEALGIPLDPDGDVDALLVIPDDESARRDEIMTEEEMLEALKAKGYTITPKKTVEEELRELRAQVAQLQATPDPQRQTQAKSAMTEGSEYAEEEMYMQGDYLATSIHPKHWRALAGWDSREGRIIHQRRAVPWPKEADPMNVVREMAPFMAYGMLAQEAATMQRDLTTFIAPDERI